MVVQKTNKNERPFTKLEFVVDCENEIDKAEIEILEMYYKHSRRLDYLYATRYISQLSTKYGKKETLTQATAALMISLMSQACGISRDELAEKISQNYIREIQLKTAVTKQTKKSQKALKNSVINYAISGLESEEKDKWYDLLV
jgi:hypothetical protein